MKNLALLVLFLFLVSTAEAQKQYFDNNKTYSVAKIYQKGKPAFEVRDIKQINDTVLLYKMSGSQGSGKQQELPTTNVRYIAVKNGTHAISYGAYGGAVGLLSALYGVLSVKNDPTLDDSSVNWAPFVIGFTAGGAALGALVGTFVPKWKILYLQDKGTTYSIKISPDINKYYCGLGLKINF